MSLPATDAFTDTTGTLLTAHGTSWTDNNGRFDIESNQICNDAGTLMATVASHWNADVFNNDQYGQLVVSRTGTGDFFYLGPSVRCASGATVTFYFFWNGPDENRLGKVVAGTETQIGASGTSWVPSNGSLTQRLEVSGSTLTPLINGSTTGTPGVQTDASIASGSAGIAGWSFNSGNRLFTQGDNWEGGNLGAPAFAPKPLIVQQAVNRAAVF